jgi:hypothetical protein
VKRSPELRHPLGLGFGIRPRIARWRYRNVGLGEPGDPMPELINTRGIRTVVLIGLLLGGLVREWSRRACRCCTEPCALISVNDPPDTGTSQEALRAHGCNALGNYGSLPVPLTRQCLVVIGPDAWGYFAKDAYHYAGVVVHVSARAQAAADVLAEYKANASWRAIALLNDIHELAIVAWEPVAK